MGGPARTRTWDQGIMRNTNSSELRNQVEEAQEPFRCPYRPKTQTELIPNARPRTVGISCWKVGWAHRVAGSSQPNRYRICRDRSRRGEEALCRLRPCHLRFTMPAVLPQCIEACGEASGTSDRGQIVNVSSPRETENQVSSSPAVGESDFRIPEFQVYTHLLPQAAFVCGR